jgi:AcrR family transcriptional regulator
MNHHSPFRSGRWFTENSDNNDKDQAANSVEELKEQEQEDQKAAQFKQMARAFQRENDESTEQLSEIPDDFDDLSIPTLTPVQDEKDFVEPSIDAEDDERASDTEDLGSSQKLQKDATGRRAKEREQRRRDIVDTARRLFAERGFQGCTMEELCKITEFAKPTLYKFFGSKEELFYSILLDGYSDLEAILRGSRKKPRVTDQFRNVCVMYLIYFRKHLDFFQIHRQVGDRLRRDSDVPQHHQAKDALHRIYKGMEDMLRDGLLLGEFRPLDPKKTCLIFFEALSVYTYAFREQEEFRTAHEMADEVMSLFLDGLRLPIG